jgi:hypothetical protein
VADFQVERHGLTVGEQLLAVADDDGMHQQVQLVDKALFE